MKYCNIAYVVTKIDHVRIDRKRTTCLAPGLPQVPFEHPQHPS